MNRRQFIRAGLLGSAALAAGSAWVVWRDVREADHPGSATQSRDRVAEIVAAIAPVLLAGALAADPGRRSVELVDVTQGVKFVIAGFPPAVRSEVLQLFRLLDIRIARRLLAGFSAPWQDAGRKDIEVFLERWRHSPFTLLQGGYFALHDMVLGAWYAREASWAALGYGGPPAVE